MLTRRHFLQAAAAAAALLGPDRLTRAATRQRLTQDELLHFAPLGQVTLLHVTDTHAQLRPAYLREPSLDLGVGSARGKVPHLTGAAFLRHFGLTPGTPEAYALTADDFVALAGAYGRLGGLDRLATIVKAIRAERTDNTLLLDGGDCWQGSFTALETRGADMVRAMNALGVDAMTGHWEFTYGQARVRELAGKLAFPFLAGNVRDTAWDEDVFPGEAEFERGGVRIAVIGQAFPHTAATSPRWVAPDWSFGLDEARLRRRVAAARDKGAELVVLLSHNGFDVDRKLAGRVPGIDVILTGHSHDALPAVVPVGRTLLVASGSHGKFLSRLDLELSGGRVSGWRYRLIPVFADAIEPDPAMAALVKDVRAPYESQLAHVAGKADTLLYRRGTFVATFDDLICTALRTERDAEISLSPGFRWGTTLLPGQDITMEDIYAETAITYPNVYRAEMTGAEVKAALEQAADGVFNPDPYRRPGGDMLRVGGLSYAVDVRAKLGRRISDLRLLRTGEPIEAGHTYTVAGWASPDVDADGPPAWDLVQRHIESVRAVRVAPDRAVKVTDA